MHFATRVWRSSVFRHSCSSRLFTRAAASKMPAIISSPLSTFLLYTSLFVQPHKQKLNDFKQLSLGNRTEIRHMFICTFFSQWPVPSRPRILTFPPESVCVAKLYVQVPVFPDTKKLNFTFSEPFIIIHGYARITNEMHTFFYFNILFYFTVHLYYLYNEPTNAQSINSFLYCCLLHCPYHKTYVQFQNVSPILHSQNYVT